MGPSGVAYPPSYQLNQSRKMQSEIDKKQDVEHDDLERAPTGKGEMVEERIELSEEDVCHHFERWQ
jgi:hypothetical protein